MLEYVCGWLYSLDINDQAQMGQALLDHYLRKHGKNAYGQGK